MFEIILLHSKIVSTRLLSQTYLQYILRICAKEKIYFQFNRDAILHYGPLFLKVGFKVTFKACFAKLDFEKLPLFHIHKTEEVGFKV